MSDFILAFFCLLAAGQAIIAFMVIRLFYGLILKNDRRIKQVETDSGQARQGDRADRTIDS